MWKPLANVVNWFELQVGKIHWQPKNTLTEDEKERVRQLLSQNYYIVLTRRDNHLSTYFIQLTDLFLRGKLGFYCHALMNFEDEVKTDEDFRLIEAIGSGVKLSTFDEVFDCHSVCILKPRSMTAEEWTAVLDKAKTELGKPYDTLFDLKSDKALSCVELVRTSLMAEPGYETDFANFEAMINKYKNLTPQMFRDCPDFEVVYEVKRHQY
jgi:uncharacterized protein YycO